VDRFEGSLVEITADGREVPYSPHLAPNGHSVKAQSRAGVKPQAHISMNQAQKACKASGKRLCHAGEWKAACQGPEKTRYPYGNQRVAGACVDTGRASPVNQLQGGRYNHTAMNDPMLNQIPNTVELTGATSTCTNGYGVMDMVGNVHEWADDGAFHGGYYRDTAINGEGCSYKTTAHGKDYYDYSTGFRCCADAGTLPADEEQKGNDPQEPVASVQPAASEGEVVALALTRPALESIHDGDVAFQAFTADLTADRNSHYDI